MLADDRQEAQLLQRDRATPSVIKLVLFHALWEFEKFQIVCPSVCRTRCCNVHAGARGEGTATCDVTVHVTDVNDNSPQWLEATPAVVYVLETRTTPIVLVTATDLDAGNNGTVTYSLNAGRSIGPLIRYDTIRYDAIR